MPTVDHNGVPVARGSTREADAIYEVPGVSIVGGGNLALRLDGGLSDSEASTLDCPSDSALFVRSTHPRGLRKRG